MSRDLNCKLADMLQVGHNVTAFTLHCRAGHPPQLDVTRVLIDGSEIKELASRFELRDLPGGIHFDLDCLVWAAQRRVKDAIDRSAARHLREMAPPSVPMYKHIRIESLR